MVFKIYSWPPDVDLPSAGLLHCVTAFRMRRAAWRPCILQQPSYRIWGVKPRCGRVQPTAHRQGRYCATRDLPGPQRHAANVRLWQ